MTAARTVYPSYGTPPCLRPGVAPDDLTLIATTGAVQFAREQVRQAVTDWGLGYMTDRCERAAIELVTRAVQTTGRPGPVPRDIDTRKKPPPTLVGVRVCLLDDHVLIEVWDGNGSSPLPGRDEFLDDHLSIVNEISSRWNWYRCGEDAGKVIWAEFGLSQPRPSTLDEPLPQRTAGSFRFPEPQRPITTLRDLDLLTRVRDGLRGLGVGGETR